MTESETGIGIGIGNETAIVKGLGEVAVMK